MTISPETPRGDALEELFPGRGESAVLMRGIDWSRTPLGATEAWPQSLRTIVPIMLVSRFAMRVIWGSEFIFLYNDAYRPILGASKHPSAMASRTAESFHEVWDIVGPLFRTVYAGTAVALENALLPLDRNGYLEECYFTLSNSPITDDSGKVAGLLGVVNETTDQVLSERRLRTLRNLASVPATESAPRALELAGMALGRNPADVPFALFYVTEPDGLGARLVARQGLDAGSAAAPPLVDLRAAPDIGWPLTADAASTRSVPDVRRRFGELQAGPYPEPVSLALVVPIRRAGVVQCFGFFVAGVSPRRALDDEYLGFFDLASEHILSAVSEALDREELALLRRAEVAARAAAEEGRAERARLLRSEQAARAEAERSSHAKDEFLAIVSHELRNPLSAMLGWTRLLRGGALTPEQKERGLETIERNAVNQSQLIEDLLDVSRIVSGKLRLEVKVVNLCEVVRAALDSARPAMDAKQLEIQATLDPELWLMGDATRLQQVVWNLLTNATKFTPIAGSIRLDLKRAEPMLELTVADSGKGIGPAFLSDVFRPFMQADGTTTRSHGGLGLGLSIAKNLVEMHGGTIAVHSEGEGQGSIFVVRLPLAPLRSTGAGDSPEARPAHTGPRWERPPEIAGLRVLVVDDERDARDLIATVLEYCGAIVEHAGSAREGLEKLDTWRPDVLLSDIGMPDGDGFALIRQVRARALDGGGSIPVASLTAYAGSEDRRRALLAGFNMHVAKPIEPAELVAVVANLARLARALR